MPASSSPVIIWFRDDLRLADQVALHDAVATNQPVLPVFILDQRAGRWAPGAATLWWLHHSLAALRQSLAEHGATGATDVFTGGSADPFARRIDQQAAESLERLGCRLHRMRTTTLFHPESVRTKTGNAYAVYTPFANACLAMGGPKDPLPAPSRIKPASSPPSDT